MNFVRSRLGYRLNGYSQSMRSRARRSFDERATSDASVSMTGERYQWFFFHWPTTRNFQSLAIYTTCLHLHNRRRYYPSSFKLTQRALYDLFPFLRVCACGNHFNQIFPIHFSSLAVFSFIKYIAIISFYIYYIILYYIFIMCIILYYIIIKSVFEYIYVKSTYLPILTFKYKILLRANSHVLGISKILMSRDT